MKLIWTETAAMWLQRIHEYISDYSPERATRVVREIYDRACILKYLPESGYRYSPDGTRILLWGHYRIAYKINGDAVVILGVFHGAMDIDRYLDEF